MGVNPRRPAVLLAAAAVLVSLAVPAASDSLGKAGGRARDCVAGEASLDRASTARVDFAVWCAVQAGEVRFSFGRAEGGEVLGFGRRIPGRGPGALGSFRCKRRIQKVMCAGRVGGPVTLRGWMEVPAGARCAEPIRVRTAGLIYAAKPIGCPGAHRERAPRDLGYMRGFRRSFGLDPDLHGDRAAVDRRIRGLLRAWRRGEPVARVTTDELGLPLRASDDRELEYRDIYIEQTATILERWAPRHAAASYAGYEVDQEHGGIFYIGFTGDQEAQVAAFKARFDLIAPERIEPFPIPPTHSERELLALEEEVLDWWTSHPGVLDDLSLDTMANKVKAGAKDVTRAQGLLAERFGDEAPIIVVHSPGGTLL
jgi:hypothetical protein